MSRSKNKEAFLDLDKITIIGGMGFIGSQLVAKLSKFCKKIVILTRNKASNSGITVLPNLEIIQVDVNDERILKVKLPLEMPTKKTPTQAPPEVSEIPLPPSESMPPPPGMPPMPPPPGMPPMPPPVTREEN